MEMSAATRRATYADLLAVPEHLVAEILDGELFTFPRPALRHARVATKLGGTLDAQFDGPPGPDRAGGWLFLDEPEHHLGDDDLVPDLAGWRLERMPEVPDGVGCTLAPDWVCEVLSPSTATVDRTRKMRIYAREGVRHLWLIDPLVRTVEVFRLEAGRWVVASTHGGDEALRAEPFDAVALDPSRWWPTPAAPPARSP